MELEGDMRRRIGYALIIVAVILAAVACQPKAWWEEDYWWPDRFPGKPEGPSETVPEKDIAEEFLKTFNPGQALIDAASGRSDIWFEDKDSPEAISSRSSLNARAVDGGMIYRYVHFNGYQQSSLGLIYNDGYMVFSIDADTVGNEGGTVYTISAAEGIEVETITGQVVKGLVIEETKSTTTAIKSITVNDAGKNVITIEGGEFSELPSSAAVTTPELGDEAISKAESELVEVQIDPEEAVRDLGIKNILTTVMSSELREYPDGIQVLSTEVLRDEGYVVFNVVLDDYIVNDNTVSGKFRLTLYPSSTFNSGSWPIESYEAESDGDLIITTDGNSGYRLSFRNVNGPCSVTATYLKTATAAFTDFSSLFSNYQGSFTVNDKTITEGTIYGEGTESSPFRIGSGQELVDFFSNEANFDKHVVLVNDVYLDGLSWPNNHSRYPSFSGHFDGGNNSIENLHIESAGSTGFMDIQEGGVFENVSFVNASVSMTSGAGNPDYLSIFPENHGTIRNVSVDSDSMISTAIKCYIGGIVGFNGPAGVIENVSNAASMEFNFSTSSAVGGIAGISAGKIIGAVNTADIIDDGTAKTSQIGGIVGLTVQGSEIVNSRNEGNITGTLSAGGIVGIIDDYSDGPSEGGVKISNVINTGDITAPVASGIAGRIESDLYAPIELLAATNTGSVTGDDIAGIITITVGTYGPDVIVAGAANTGSLAGNESITGVVNNNKEPSFGGSIDITAAYSSGEKSGTASAYNGVVFNKGEVSCEACYYSSEANTEEISGVTHIEDTTEWEGAIDAMNAALAGMDFEFTVGDAGLPVLPEVEI